MHDNFLLVADSVNHGLFQIDLSGATVWRIPLSFLVYPVAVAYDPLDSKVYWTDGLEKRIKRSNLDGTVEEVVYPLDSGTCSVNIAVTIIC